MLWMVLACAAFAITLWISLDRAILDREIPSGPPTGGEASASPDLP